MVGNHMLKDWELYDGACRRRELWRDLDAETYQQVRAVLWYDKRKDGSKGRALQYPVPAANLLRGDRLEPWAGLPDTDLFDMVAVFPIRVLFWRPRRGEMITRRCPLFGPELDLSPQSLALDWLHDISLGIVQDTCAFLFHDLVAHNVFRCQ